MAVKKILEKKTPFGAVKAIARQIRNKRIDKSGHSPAGKSYLKSSDSKIDKAKAKAGSEKAMRSKKNKKIFEALMAGKYKVKK